MTKELSEQEIKAIIASQKAGFEAENEAEFVDATEITAMNDHTFAKGDAPDLEYMAAKFFKGASKPTGSSSRDSAAASNASKIVRVRPAGTHPIDANGTGSRKVVVVSAKNQRIIGEQG